jgi:hypothetical protein
MLKKANLVGLSLFSTACLGMIGERERYKKNGGFTLGIIHNSIYGNKLSAVINKNIDNNICDYLQKNLYEPNKINLKQGDHFFTVQIKNFCYVEKVIMSNDYFFSLEYSCGHNEFNDYILTNYTNVDLFNFHQKI